MARLVPRRRMNPLDDFPQRVETHDTAEAAENALRAAIGSCSFFALQQADRSDYGTDVQIEARSGEAMTNARSHIQLKGTTQATNADGSVSVPVARTNLNYLMVQSNSTYVCYHLPSRRLLARRADDVYSEYEHRGADWQRQESITVRFVELFDARFQERLHARVIAESKTSRDRRLAWIQSPPEQTVALTEHLPPAVEVPFDPTLALRMLRALYEAGHDLVISSSFARFAAVLEHHPGGMDLAYMAEINLGIAGQPCDKDRIRQSVSVLDAASSRGESQAGSLVYCQGNAYFALGEYESARDAYSRAAGLLDSAELAVVAAQCSKNLGSALEALGDLEGARECYLRALALDPDLGEARFALAFWYYRAGDNPAAALEHFDQVATRKGSALRISSVQGWRINLLFRVGQTDAAFREINALTGNAEHENWIWPWCARQVSQFGKSSSHHAKKSITFWKAYLRKFPAHTAAQRELLLCHWVLRSNDAVTEMSFSNFKSAVEQLVQAQEEDLEAAFLWDRVGHWAQHEKNWEEAERAYRRAYETEPDRYGYCLGTALNSLSRFAEALPILVLQAERHKPDAMSWFQVALAHLGLHDSARAVAAYERALELDEEYDLAWFNLGGVYWNSGEVGRAVATWREAVRRFPNHELAAKLLEDIPTIFDVE